MIKKRVMRIKSKFVMILFIGMICSFTLCEMIKAEAVMQFEKEPTYEFISEEKNSEGQIIGRRYEIYMYLKNTGDEKTVDLVVNLSDEEETPGLKNYTYFEPGESKTITFGWSTRFIRDQTLNIKYYPENLGAERTNNNSGETTLTIVMGDVGGQTTTETPGFDLLIMIVAIILLIIAGKKKF